MMIMLKEFEKEVLEVPMKNNKKTLMIDMDEVIVTGGMLRMVNDFLGTNYTEDDLTEYHIQNKIPQEEMNKWWNYFKNGNMYEKETLFDNFTYDTLYKLNEKYDLNIVTAYNTKNDIIQNLGFHINNKIEFLNKYLPFLDTEQIHFVNRKDLIKAEVKIDDKLENMNGDNLKLLFTAYHNKNLTDDYLKSVNAVRVNNWQDIANILL